MAPPKYAGKVAGLCGNFDGNHLNDFDYNMDGTKSKNNLAFANGWAISTHSSDGSVNLYILTFKSLYNILTS